jgi:hypothetical protein
MSTAACTEASAAERLVNSGKRLAALPDSCSSSRVDEFEEVRTEIFSDGERFELTVSAKCSEDWRRSLSQTSNLVCDEDWEGITDVIGPVRNPSVYSCLDQRDFRFQVWVTFRDATHAEFLWVKA